MAAWRAAARPGQPRQPGRADGGRPRAARHRADRLPLRRGAPAPAGRRPAPAPPGHRARRGGCSAGRRARRWRRGCAPPSPGSPRKRGRRRRRTRTRRARAAENRAPAGPGGPRLTPEGVAGAARRRTSPPDPEEEARSSAVGPSRPRLLGVLGPGLISGASDDDPVAIGTYAQAGAAFGYALCWLPLLCWPLMAVVQEISGRIGRTTGPRARRRHRPPLSAPLAVGLRAPDPVRQHRRAGRRPRRHGRRAAPPHRRAAPPLRRALRRALHRDAGVPALHALRRHPEMDHALAARLFRRGGPRRRGVGRRGARPRAEPVGGRGLGHGGGRRLRRRRSRPSCCSGSRRRRWRTSA